MIEKKILSKKMKEFEIEEYISRIIDKPGYSHTEIQRTPLGEKIIMHTSKPGLIVGRGGENIRMLTEVLKKKFNMENPQIEVAEIENPNPNPQTVARYIIHTFERFGPKRFKFVGHKVLQSIIDAGAIGAEIVISGRGLPGRRAKTWRFFEGHLKKSGDISENYIKRGFSVARLKSGSVGVKVSILTPDIILPDKIVFRKEDLEKEKKKIEKEETKEPEKEETKKKDTDTKETKREEKKSSKKKATKKKETKKKNGNTKKKRNKTTK